LSLEIINIDQRKTGMKKTAWFERKFPAIEDNGILPSIIERLAGTPVRLKEMINKLEPDLLVWSPGSNWTVKEQAGHLSDLEPLWLARLEDLLAGLPELKTADLTNYQTHHANHNAKKTKILLEQFKKQREVFVDKLSHLKDEQLLHSSLHPRLKTPMRIIDLAYFVAEHDDHHLAGIREILKQKGL
jgi:uncharacterized damage-inducible protein DinB